VGGKAFTYDVKIGITEDGRTLRYRRSFMFGGMLVPAGKYAELKALFDAIHERDNHTITLKQSATNSRLPAQQ
jgi:hypothetical protein